MTVSHNHPPPPTPLSSKQAPPPTSHPLQLLVIATQFGGNNDWTDRVKAPRLASPPHRLTIDQVLRKVSSSM